MFHENAPNISRCNRQRVRGACASTLLRYRIRLAEDRFYNTYPCIIITAKGQPDVSTRMFLKASAVPRH